MSKFLPTKIIFMLLLSNIKDSKESKKKIKRCIFITSKVKEITLGKGHLFKFQIPSKSRLAQKYNRSKEKTKLKLKTNLVSLL